MVMAILSALAAIPAILGYVEAFCSQVILWYIQRQNNETLAQIADAAALAARASTDQERYDAASAWEKALTRNRVSIT